MKLKIKKFIYLLNDATNLLLKKDREEESGRAGKLHKLLIFVSVLLVLSIIINLYLYFKYV